MEVQLGPTHPSTMVQLGNLAASYGANHRYDEALAVEERLVERRIATVGIDHRDTLSAQAVLAFSYRDLGRNAEAIAQLRSVVDRLAAQTQPDDSELRTWRSVLVSWLDPK
jgi:Tetratricopeptide repeat